MLAEAVNFYHRGNLTKAVFFGKGARGNAEEFHR
jgi:hypothetical protein